MKRDDAGARMLCSELVLLKWRDVSGVERESVGDLEAISPSGAWLQVDDPIPEATPLSIGIRRAELKGKVYQCTFNYAAHALAIQFDCGTKWSRRCFTPKHLLDPAVLMIDGLMRDLKPDIAACWKPRIMTADS
ncbi:MAG: hypothetical protein M3Z85_00925 [Acidobacteriota bacterium]|nr:hypothetical protein [Acidobacteriota bacterium]